LICSRQWSMLKALLSIRLGHPKEIIQTEEGVGCMDLVLLR
jgi:hypothetical protein